MKKNRSIEANQIVHTALSDIYKDSEPHYRKENIEKISGIIKSLQLKSGAKSLLDMGCGQGFIIDIAKTSFSFIRGVDVTQAMLDKVDVSSSHNCDIAVVLSSVENTPFENCSFDMCTAYAVLHHLSDLRAFFAEVNRILKPGGVFYSGLDPNGYYWKRFEELNYKESYSTIIKSELNKVLYKDKELSEKYGLEISDIDDAEAFKHLNKGFMEENIVDIMKEAGFKKIQVVYDWFLGEGQMIHDKDQCKQRDGIDQYLKLMLPISRPMFKYISIIAYK